MNIPTPKQIQLLYRLHKYKHSAVMSSEWVEGSGKRTRSLELPPFCERIGRGSYSLQPQRIKRVFDDHPRCRAVVAVVDKGKATSFLNALKGCTQ